MKKSFAFISAFLLLAFVIVGFNAWQSGKIDASKLRALAGRDDIVLEENTVRDGTILCLPQKSARANLRECIYGLQTEEGEHYELLDIERAGPLGTIERGDRVHIKGDLVVSRRERLIDVLGALRIQRVEDR
jgi:hypothetical protein